MTGEQSREGEAVKEVLDDLVRFLCRFIVFRSDVEPTFLALWLAHTHAIEAAWTTPYVQILSPAPRCGKSTLLELLMQFASSGRGASNISTAALYRLIEVQGLTLFLDEVDQQFRGTREARADLASVLNSGYKRGPTSRVVRCVGKDHDAREFETFCPKAFAMNDVAGVLSPATLDRCVTITLERRLPTDRCEDWSARRDGDAAQHLSYRLADAIADAMPALEDARVARVEALDDRAQEIWEPLLAIADLAGNGWSRAARSAAAALSARREDEDHHAILLLRHVREVFGERAMMSSKDICDALNAREEWPWPTWGLQNGRTGLTPTALARILRPFGISPGTRRVLTKTFKGYERSQFERAWERYTAESGNTDGA